MINIEEFQKYIGELCKLKNNTNTMLCYYKHDVVMVIETNTIFIPLEIRHYTYKNGTFRLKILVNNIIGYLYFYGDLNKFIEPVQ